jgi:hypothetical protein
VSRAWSAREVVRAAGADNQALMNEGEWYDARLREHRADLERIDARIGEAWEHLGSVLVPDLEPARLDDLARRVGLPAIGARAVEAGTRAEQTRLEALRTGALASSVYQHREGIRNECDIRLAECEEQIAPLRDVYKPICDDPRFRRLAANGYGTPRYAGRWWSLSYYRDWKEGDELVEAFGPAMRAQDFPAMLHKIDEARIATDVMVRERDELTARVNEVRALVAQHDDAVRALEMMPQRRLAAVRGSLRAHLEPMTWPQIAQLVGGGHDIVVALQRLSGLVAQRRYLIAAAQRDILEPRAQLAAVIERNTRDITKLSRPKNAGRSFDGAKMSKRFEARPAAFAQRREHYTQTRQAVTSFARYDRGSLARDFLWWDLMSDGRLDGDFIPEVRKQQRSRPGVDHAVAAVAERSDPADALLLHDGS